MAEPLRVLLIEDNLDDALLLEAELEREFALKVMRVDTSDALRQALPSEKWDVVISDYRLPQFDGLAALRMVHEFEPDLPFILVSGAVGEEVAAQAMRAGAEDLILKSNLFRLAPTLRRALKDAEDRRLRRQAEDALRQSEARFRAALANSQVTIFEQDLELRYTWIHNPRFGVSAEDLIGKRTGDIMEPKSAADLDQISQSVIETGNPVRQEVCAAAMGDPLRHYDMYVEPKRDGSGRIVGVISTAVDITELKLAEERERRLANLYRALGETNDAIVHLDSDAELFPLVCRVAAEYGGMVLAWVGIPDKSQNFVPAAVAGRVPRYLEELLRIAPVSCAADRPEGQGPAGVAYREGRTIVANDFTRDVGIYAAPWIELAKKHGIESVAVFPIKRGNRPYAVFFIYSDQINAFDEEIVQLFNEISGNVSFALDNLDREAMRRQAEEELKLAALVYQESGEAMMVTDASNRIVSVNPAFEQVTGYRSENVVGKIPVILSSGKEKRPAYKEMMQRLAMSNYWQGELWLKKKSGEEFAAHMTINTTFHADGTVNRHVALFNDITQKKQAEELVWHQANFDALTGLPNRQHFLDQLSLEVKKSRRSRLPMALMFLDLDGFKDVNDTLGHESGDMLLKEAAERLKRCVRESDTVARLGGDEFTIVLGELHSVRHVEKIARHILHKIEEPFQLGDQMAHVTASIGITLHPKDASNLDDLLINADHAMYAAKAAGKNRYGFFTAAMQQAAQERTWLINELRHAIDSKQLRLVYQPIVELSTGCINKAEALLRWEHPERGAIEPSVFIPIAEDTGMIQEIGDWVFQEAVSQTAKWRRAYRPDFQVSINKSPVQFKARDNDVARWLEQLRSLDLPGQAIAVEITEGVLMDESAAVKDQLLAFRDAGIEVSLDDFGTGYSTLSYLKRFDIDRLKIDQAFIRDLENDPNDQALCEAMIVMGHKLGIKVIAEGVETDGQREILANAGCDFLQGYLLSSPMSAEALGDLLRRGASYCPGMPVM